MNIVTKACLLQGNMPGNMLNVEAILRSRVDLSLPGHFSEKHIAFLTIVATSRTSESCELPHEEVK